MELIKKNKVLFIVLAVVLVLAAGGLYFITAGAKKQAQAPTTEEKQVKSVNPDEIGLKLSLRQDKKAVVMEITKLEGIKSVEYEVSYDAQVTEEGQTNNVPRGAVGSPIQIKSGDTSIKREITLGTCSANVCKYDKVTSSIKFVIKVTYKNGDLGSVEKELAL